MQLFSTILPIHKSLNQEKLIELVIEWNQNSPHQDSIIPNIHWNGERNIKFGNDSLWLSIEEYRNQNILAIRYEKVDSNDAVWDTDFIMNFQDRKMAIRLERSYIKDAPTTYHDFSTPYLLNLLINNGYVEDDYDLPITSLPIKISEDNVEVLTNIINQKTQYSLPVVYVSKTSSEIDPINVENLAYKLRGVAHVLVEESYSLNNLIRSFCNDKNEFNGAIGIYYPKHNTGCKRYLYYPYTGIDKILTQKVINSVMQFSASKLIASLYTWAGVNTALLQDRLSEQKNKRLLAENAQVEAENRANDILTSLDENKRRIHAEAMADAKVETNKILESFEDEINNYKEQIAMLKRENENLLYENQGLNEKLATRGSEPILYMGNEDEFYTGEVKDIILTVLNDSLKNMQKSSRRSHIVKDIINTNNFQYLSQKKAKKLKLLFNDYTNMSAKLRQELTKLGFTISDDGKHYKISYHGDERYVLVVAKSASDFRAGNNNASILTNLIF